MSALIAGCGAEDVLLLARDSDAEDVSAARFCDAALRLARTLPSAGYAINRCEDPTRFLLATAAALIAGHSLLLPPSRALDMERDLRVRFPDAYALVDDGRDDEGHVTVPPVQASGETQWPPPSIPGGHVAAILFTSGSTGTPTPHPKTWSSLVRGAGTFARSFGPLPHDAAIVGTVAPQHMFGFETTALVPLQAGVPLVAVRPLFPADLGDALRALASRGRRPWLLTTPLHLRMFHEALRDLRPARVIVSTMPMPDDLARDIECDWRAPVHEIYGCTEGGMLATRRPAQDARFVPAAGLRFALDRDGLAQVSGGQLDAPLAVADRFECAGEPSQRLTLIGRAGDLVKVAGKRTTVAELSAILQSIPGVRDGTYLVAEPDAERVAALVVAPLHDAASLRRALAARIDRVFLPRPLVFVEKLPRDAQGKLARAAVLERLRCADPAARPDRTFQRACTVRASHPSLPGHFPGRPMVPGAVLLARVEALLRAQGLRIVAMPVAKFTRAVRPDESLTVRVDVIDGDHARFAIDAKGDAAASGTLRIGAAT
jgi:acyl-coenzyme A synthetase/AMP-(fatty) acid ligase/3-hydroxymyristoyl/3-hydroxydecanoyl-(acyl carrier protein) dehydratase